MAPAVCPVIEVGLALLGALAALILALRVRRIWSWQLGLAAIGLLAISTAAVVSDAIDCAGCTPPIGPRFAAFLAVGWLLGIAVAQLRRRRGSTRRPRTTSVAVAVALLLLALGVVVYGRYGYAVWTWGCPTNDELRRVQSVEEVAAAFAWHGLALEPIPPPAWLPPSEPAYRGARAFRYRRPGATEYVLVCRDRCAISWNRFAEARRVGEQRWRIGMDSGNNVAIWVTEDYARAGRLILEETEGPRARIHPYVEYGSRCYTN